VNRRGFGRFARGILSGLITTNPGHQVEIFADRSTAARIEVPEGVLIRSIDSNRMSLEAATARGNRSFTEIGRMMKSVCSAGYDAVYFPSSMTFVPLPGVKNVIVTMHDTLAVDRPDLVFPTRSGRWFWWLKEQAARWSATRITTVSETSRRDLARYFGMNESRIGILTEGVDPVFHRMPESLPDRSDVFARYRLPENRPIWTYVGGLSPHKNLIRLIEAFAGMPESIGDLVLVGDFADTFHTHIPELRSKVAASGCQSRIHMPGFVPDDELAVLYRASQAVVLPSLWEGFGLPAAEAMACGVPVLHSTAGSLPEIVGEAGLSFDPLSIDSMKVAWNRLANDEALRNRLIERGRERALLYRWERAGRMLWDEIETVAVRSGRTKRHAG
jgi:glycosyltransferase involved in cell wall biosynthesis